MIKRALLVSTLICTSTAAADSFEDRATPHPLVSELQGLMAGRNVQLEAIEMQVSTDPGWNGAALTLIANNRTHRLNTQFVENDPRREGRSNITYLVDQSDGAALSRTTTNQVVALPNSLTEGVIDRSMFTWSQQTFCQPPAITKVADDGSDPDLIDGFVFNNPALIGTPRADITHGGWLTRSFFDRLAPNGGSFILGVTFTFIFVDENGNPTDLDRDGRADTAFREIFYNRGFAWADASTNGSNVDLESVITHEVGHAFGLGHFGRVFWAGVELTLEKLNYAPRAVMNAVYTSRYPDLAGTDRASFCSIWAN